MTTVTQNSKFILPPSKKPNPVFQPKKWQWLIPVITATALGAIFVPKFGLGLVLGSVQWITTFSIITLLSKLGAIKFSMGPSKEPSAYELQIKENLLTTAIFIPLIEESIFRGGIQPLFSQIIKRLSPSSASTPFLKKSISIPTAAGIAITAGLFGAIHLPNPHNEARIQAIIATFIGISHGTYSAKWGISAAIAAHIANNTISCIELELGSTS